MNGLITKSGRNLCEIETDFWWITTFANIWKETGWNSIIYIAAIAGIDQSLYEVAELDGAGRFRKMWHVTLPGIKSTIIVLLIMNLYSIAQKTAKRKDQEEKTWKNESIEIFGKR